MPSRKTLTPIERITRAALRELKSKNTNRMIALMSQNDRLMKQNKKLRDLLKEGTDLLEKCLTGITVCEERKSQNLIDEVRRS